MATGYNSRDITNYYHSLKLTNQRMSQAISKVDELHPQQLEQRPSFSVSPIHKHTRSSFMKVSQNNSRERDGDSRPRGGSVLLKRLEKSLSKPISKQDSILHLSSVDKQPSQQKAAGKRVSKPKNSNYLNENKIKTLFDNLKPDIAYYQGHQPPEYQYRGGFHNNSNTESEMSEGPKKGFNFQAKRILKVDDDSSDWGEGLQLKPESPEQFFKFLEVKEAPQKEEEPPVSHTNELAQSRKKNVKTLLKKLEDLKIENKQNVLQIKQMKTRLIQTTKAKKLDFQLDLNKVASRKDDLARVIEDKSSRRVHVEQKYRSSVEAIGKPPPAAKQFTQQGGEKRKSPIKTAYSPLPVKKREYSQGKEDKYDNLQKGLSSLKQKLGARRPSASEEEKMIEVQMIGQPSRAAAAAIDNGAGSSGAAGAERQSRAEAPRPPPAQGGSQRVPPRRVGAAGAREGARSSQARQIDSLNWVENQLRSLDAGGRGRYPNLQNRHVGQQMNRVVSHQVFSGQLRGQGWRSNNARPSGPSPSLQAQRLREKQSILKDKLFQDNFLDFDDAKFKEDEFNSQEREEIKNMVKNVIDSRRDFKKHKNTKQKYKPVPLVRRAGSNLRPTPPPVASGPIARPELNLQEELPSLDFGNEFELQPERILEEEKEMPPSELPPAELSPISINEEDYDMETLFDKSLTEERKPATGTERRAPKLMKPSEQQQDHPDFTSDKGEPKVAAQVQLMDRLDPFKTAGSLKSHEAKKSTPSKALQACSAQPESRMKILKTAILTDNKAKVRQVLDSETKMSNLQSFQAQTKMKFKMVKFDKLKLTSSHLKSAQQLPLGAEPGQSRQDGLRQPGKHISLSKQASSPSMPMSVVTSMDLQGEFSSSKIGTGTASSKNPISQIQILSSLAKYNKKFSQIANREVRQIKDIGVRDSQKIGRRQSMLELGGVNHLDHIQAQMAGAISAKISVIKPPKGNMPNSSIKRAGTSIGKQISTEMERFGRKVAQKNGTNITPMIDPLKVLPYKGLAQIEEFKTNMNSSEEEQAHLGEDSQSGMTQRQDEQQGVDPRFAWIYDKAEKLSNEELPRAAEAKPANQRIMEMMKTTTEGFPKQTDSEDGDASWRPPVIEGRAHPLTKETESPRFSLPHSSGRAASSFKDLELSSKAPSQIHRPPQNENSVPSKSKAGSEQKSTSGQVKGGCSKGRRPPSGLGAGGTGRFSGGQIQPVLRERQSSRKKYSLTSDSYTEPGTSSKPSEPQTSSNPTSKPSSMVSQGLLPSQSKNQIKSSTSSDSYSQFKSSSMPEATASENQKVISAISQQEETCRQTSKQALEQNQVLPQADKTPNDRALARIEEPSSSCHEPGSATYSEATVPASIPQTGHPSVVAPSSSDAQEKVSCGPGSKASGERNRVESVVSLPEKPSHRPRSEKSSLAAGRGAPKNASYHLPADSTD